MSLVPNPFPIQFPFVSRPLVFGFVQGNGDAVAWAADNLGLVELGVPVAAVLDPLVLLQEADHWAQSVNGVGASERQGGLRV